MTERTLRGVIPPMVTPFKDDESIDHEAFVQELEFLLQFDIDGLSIGGSTGEGAHFPYTTLFRSRKSVV